MSRYILLLLLLIAGTALAHDWRSVWVGPVTTADLRLFEESGITVEAVFGERARLSPFKVD